MNSSEFMAREIPGAHGPVQRADRMPQSYQTFDYASGLATGTHEYTETAFNEGERHFPIAGSSLQPVFSRTFRYSDPTGLIHPPWNPPSNGYLHDRSPIDSASVTYDGDWSPSYNIGFEDSSTVGA